MNKVLLIVLMFGVALFGGSVRSVVAADLDMDSRFSAVDLDDYKMFDREDLADYLDDSDKLKEYYGINNEVEIEDEEEVVDVIEEESSNESSDNNAEPVVSMVDTDVFRDRFRRFVPTPTPTPENVGRIYVQQRIVSNESDVEIYRSEVTYVEKSSTQEQSSIGRFGRFFGGFGRLFR